MKPRQRAIKAARRASGIAKRANKEARSAKLRTILALVRAHPGIRPSELNRLMKLEQSDDLRNALIRRGLIRKERDGSAMRYYPV
jgi:hypothetical protein